MGHLLPGSSGGPRTNARHALPFLAWRGACFVAPEQRRQDGGEQVKVLLADEDAERARDLARTLAADPLLEVVRVPPGESLADAVAQHQPDVVLVDIARPDRDALDGLRRVSASAPRPVVLFVDEDDPGFMEEAIAAGVCSSNVAEVAPPDIRPLLRAAVALFRRHRETAEGLRAAELRLADRRIIERAKAALIRERRLAEPEAYRWLRRQAMRRGERIVEVAARLLREQEEQA
jgi:two-component system, response regulator / RNA-binding antiterminator